MKPLTKAELRAELRQRLRMLDAPTREREAARLRERVRICPAWTSARSVLLFASRPDEPDLWPLVRQALSEGKQVALPFFDPASGIYGARRVGKPASDLVPGRFGIPEPHEHCPQVMLATLDLVLVPGLGFTTEGGRLGRGGGFYDRLLAATGAVRVGVGLDVQIVPWLPLETHDTMLDYIVTPSAVHRGRTRQN